MDSLLGAGSMAAVYAVTHRNGARAALKILHPTLSVDPGVCERFLGEGYLTNSVKHPGIVCVLDDGVTEDGCVFLVMDLLAGRTLEALREERGGQIGIAETLDIADKLMDVLKAVHDAGIVHRDLKPQNVFVCHDGSVKLLDFGVARIFDGTKQSKLSTVGLVLGTPSFMSPEQALGARDKVDHRSDIWSLGATLFTSLTGQAVHLGPHVQAKLLAAATVKARSIAMAKFDLPPPIVHAIDTALMFDKRDRWQSVDAFRRALREARSALGIAAPESERSESLFASGAVDCAPMTAETLVGLGPVDVPNDLGAAPHPPHSGADGPDGSYPGAASTLKVGHNALFRAESATRRGLVSWVVIGLFSLVSLAAGATALVVHKRGGAARQAGASRAEPALRTPSSATSGSSVRIPSPPLPSPDVDPKDLVIDAGSAPESTMEASLPAPSPQHPGPPAQPSVLHNARPGPLQGAPEKASAPRTPSRPSEPPARPTLAPDPFGTPD